MTHIPDQFNVSINNRFAELIPIVDEMMPNELWENIKITTAKVAKRNYRANASGRNSGYQKRFNRCEKK